MVDTLIAEDYEACESQDPSIEDMLVGMSQRTGTAAVIQTGLTNALFGNDIHSLIYVQGDMAYEHICVGKTTLFVEKGRVTVQIGGKELNLSRGDSMKFPMFGEYKLTSEYGAVVAEKCRVPKNYFDVN
ncbi:hypothetical protein HN587_07045 [Candidatus Woesearchaeota archaeon]|jgi:hypothetical protein|nr:hypothetical protein [Candidatus Woesearchaeota archaeon]